MRATLTAISRPYSVLTAAACVRCELAEGNGEAIRMQPAAQQRRTSKAHAALIKFIFSSAREHHFLKCALQRRWTRASTKLCSKP